MTHDRLGDYPGVSPAHARLVLCHARAGGGWLLFYARSDRPTGADGRRERVMRSRVVLYSSRPALACIIGARRAWTVETISSEEMPWR